MIELEYRKRIEDLEQEISLLRSVISEMRYVLEDIGSVVDEEVFSAWHSAEALRLKREGEK